MGNGYQTRLGLGVTRMSRGTSHRSPFVRHHLDRRRPVPIHSGDRQYTEPEDHPRSRRQVSRVTKERNVYYYRKKVNSWPKRERQQNGFPRLLRSLRFLTLEPISGCPWVPRT